MELARAAALASRWRNSSTASDNRREKGLHWLHAYYNGFDKRSTARFNSPCGEGANDGTINRDRAMLISHKYRWIYRTPSRSLLVVLSSRRSQIDPINRHDQCKDQCKDTFNWLLQKGKRMEKCVSLQRLSTSSSPVHVLTPIHVPSEP